MNTSFYRTPLAATLLWAVCTMCDANIPDNSYFNAESEEYWASHHIWLARVVEVSSDVVPQITVETVQVFTEEKVAERQTIPLNHFWIPEESPYGQAPKKGLTLLMSVAREKPAMYLVIKDTEQSRLATLVAGLDEIARVRAAENKEAALRAALASSNVKVPEYCLNQFWQLEPKKDDAELIANLVSLRKRRDALGQTRLDADRLLTKLGAHILAPVERVEWLKESLASSQGHSVSELRPLIKELKKAVSDTGDLVDFFESLLLDGQGDASVRIAAISGLVDLFDFANPASELSARVFMVLLVLPGDKDSRVAQNARGSLRYIYERIPEESKRNIYAALAEAADRFARRSQKAGKP